LNVELQLSYNAIRSVRALLSTSMLSNICPREYPLTVDAIHMQLPSRNIVSLALDGWTSTNKFVLMLVIPYDMDQNWVLREVQLAFNKFDSHFFSYFKS